MLNVRSLAGRVFLLEIVIVLLLIGIGATALVLQSETANTNDARRVTRAVAESFAHSPGMVDAINSPDPSKVLQPETETIRATTGVDAVNVFNNSSVQLTSPDPTRIGQVYHQPEYVRTNVIPQLLQGHTVTFTLHEPGYSAIATAVPVFAPDGTAEGVVSVNITVQRVNSVGGNLPLLLGGAAAAVALAAAGTALVSRRLLRQTRGLGPEDITRMYEHHDAVLHAVREGVVVIGTDDRLILANDEARRVLGLPAGVERKPVSELGLDPGTVALLTSDDMVTDAVHRAGDRMLVVNKRPTAPYGGLPGSVVTLRDSTELYALTGRVEVARQRLQLLYDAGVGIGTTLDMGVTSQELAQVAVPRFADIVSVDLIEAVTRGEEPDAGGRRLRRTALAGDTVGSPLHPVGSALTLEAATPQAQSLETGRPFLVDDLAASQDWRALDPVGATQIVDQGVHSLLAVPLRARGVVLGLAGFWRAEGSPPFDPDDVSFAEELAARAAVSIDNARRYTREHSMAMSLQRSLLPSTLPEHTALDVAFRYLPAHAGVGGDWFDVIALPGFRTALVVGDVVGHGITAAVAMGRLRTAVHNFSALDLPPEEVLGRLDELVTRLDSEASGTEITGSTCLYAVYDPVAGRCAIALAGHPGPALVSPDGTVEFPDVPVSLPLGVGGHPVRTTELSLREGSKLVLFTNGLVENREQDLGAGLSRLRHVLAEDTTRSPDEICQAVTAEMLASRPADDVALLVARTHLLEREQIAEWDVEPVPSAVSPIRAACGRKLTEWGLEDIGFTTELILSELITNAIRHGSPPIKVRLLRASTLVCEVSDGSSTSPHLRWAATTDEGGRGIFLVSQLAHRWGTRYTPGGKVIWSEQLLHSGPDGPGPDLGPGLGPDLADTLLEAEDL
ncbi:SpoIIE family protein phosphatase [Streptomyces sp. PLK6-54]|uniref:SpoIIE family protein phosphatase n=1 Tax=Actinacidiphila acidipaludis TaxID=2873382 RepID=A0ABS7QF18_9ACTN|nr:SpoIIE family protein phosphatase [Streptomyces acidipaludis]